MPLLMQPKAAAAAAQRAASSQQPSPKGPGTAEEGIAAVHNFRKSIHSERPDDDADVGSARKSRALVSEDEFAEVLEKEGISTKEDFKKVILVERNEFDMAIGAVICLNALVMGFECDLKTPSTEDHPTWAVLDNAFCLVWIFEMLLKLKTYRCKYFRNAWNILDFFLVLLAINDAWVMPFFQSNAMNALGVIRMVRLLRILRLLRLLRLMKMFKNLWLIVSGFTESLSTLYWVLLLMGVVIYVFGVFLRSTINCEEQFFAWADCSTMFGSIPKTMYTLFQVITLESWSMAIGRPLFFIQPWFFPVFVIFLFLTTFGILNIIVGVIVENTLNAAKQNQDLQDKRMQKQLIHDLETLRVVFEEADADGSMTLELEEFTSIMKMASVRAMLARMEIPMDDAGTLFKIIDQDGEGSISFKKFTEGVMKVKGPPTGVDMKAMQVSVRGISMRLNKLESMMEQVVMNQEETNRMLVQKFGCSSPQSGFRSSPMEITSVAPSSEEQSDDEMLQRRLRAQAERRKMASMRTAQINNHAQTQPTRAIVMGVKSVSPLPPSVGHPQELQDTLPGACNQP